MNFKYLTHTISRYCLLLILFSISAFTNAKTYSIGSTRDFNIIIDELYDDNYIDFDNEPEIQTYNNYDAIFDKVISEGKVVSELSESSFYSLPVAVLPMGSTDYSYALIIDHAEIHPEYAVFNAFMILTNPIDNKRIQFKAENIKLSFETGLIDDITLKLINDQTTRIANDIYVKWLAGTYVTWDCNGFKSIGLNAEIELCEKKFQEIDTQTFEEKGKVKTTFFAEFNDYKDFLIELTLPAFKIIGIDEIGFKFTDLVLDFSISSNTNTFKLPTNYPSAYVSGDENEWRGIYAKKAEVFLSSKFNDNNDNTVSFYAEGLLLDNYGVTGIIGAKNILSMDNGSLGDWKFSIKDINIELLAGRQRSFSFQGEIQLPGTSTELAYDAYLDAESNYHLGIESVSEIDFNMFAAKAIIHESSRIDLYVNQGKFVPTALLNGHLNFNVSAEGTASSNSTFNMPSLRFEGFRISAVPPILDIKYLEYSSGNSNGELANLPITIDSISFNNKTAGEVSLDFDLTINLSPATGGSITGDSRVSIISDISGKDWKFKKLDVSKVSVSTEYEGAFEFSGSLTLFENDPTYGKGFKGSVSAVFANTIKADASALFGKVDDYRYFSVDAHIYNPGGVMAGPFIINGFGGGISYRMKQQLSGSKSVSEIGKTLSGLYYAPNKNIGLGISAGLKGGLLNKNIIQGELNFAIVFGRSGGIEQISFKGEAALLAIPDNLTPDKVLEVAGIAADNGSQKANLSQPMRAGIFVLMDFNERVFHSEFEVYLNIAGAIKGVGPNNRAGWAVLHHNPNKWYLHVGTPDDPIGLSMLGGLFETQSYFMAGHDLPSEMKPDSRVSEILNLNQTGPRDNNSLITGKGFAFGSKTSFDTGPLTFLIFYAAFDMGFGFDVMLLKYPDNIYCKGFDRFGINSWYAKGQIYAYLAGKIGLTAKVFGKHRTFDIITLQAATAFSMEGPNPIWMKGNAGGNYSVLGGMIKGKCNFEITVGNKCDMKQRTQSLADMEIIGDVTPDTNSKEVDPFIYPQVVFNMPVGKELKIAEDENTTKYYRVNLAEYSLFSGSNKVPGTIQWNDEKTSFAFRPDSVLLPTHDYRIVVKINFDEKVGSNWTSLGSYWTSYKDDSGKIHYETREISFTTDELPPIIPDHAIAFTYPLKRMMNFYSKEYPKAYIGLDKWISGYFTPIEGFTKMAKWTPVKGGTAIYTNLTIKSGQKLVEADVPAGLSKGLSYNFELVNVPTNKSNAVDRNVVASTEKVAEEDGDGIVAEVTTAEADGIIGDSEDITFYSLSFRVSKYETLAQKVGANELDVRFLYNSSPAIDYPGVTIYPDEPFDGYEIINESNSNPVIQLSAVLESADWYKNNIYPIMYDGYPFAPNAKVDRDISLYGMPPTKPVWIWQVGYGYIMTDDDIQNQTINSNAEMSHFVYALPRIWASDYVTIRNNISNNINKDNRTEKMKYILINYPWPQVSAGNYPIKIEYVLPGINKVSSSFILNMKNGFDIPQVKLSPETNHE